MDPAGVPLGSGQAGGVNMMPGYMYPGQNAQMVGPNAQMMGQNAQMVAGQPPQQQQAPMTGPQGGGQMTAPQSGAMAMQHGMGMSQQPGLATMPPGQAWPQHVQPGQPCYGLASGTGPNSNQQQQQVLESDPGKSKRRRKDAPAGKKLVIYAQTWGAVVVPSLASSKLIALQSVGRQLRLTASLLHS